jgi:flagellar basal body rod protein FlgF
VYDSIATAKTVTLFDGITLSGELALTTGTVTLMGANAVTITGNITVPRGAALTVGDNVTITSVEVPGGASAGTLSMTAVGTITTL